MSLDAYPRPSLTADIVIFTIRDRRLHVLLIERGVEPFRGRWAIPGGFVQPTETLEEAARRELREETGVGDVFLEQLRAFGTPDRDPRGWVVTVAFTALVPSDRLLLRAATDAADARWFPADDLPGPLAFDHDLILGTALDALHRRLETGQAACALLPARFTLTEMQAVYEALLGHALDKRNFRKWALGLGLLADTGETQRGRQRPAALYEFVARANGVNPPWGRRPSEG